MKKSLGQHFLIAPSTIKKIIEVAHVTQTDTVLEVGPGDGALTRRLLEYAQRVIAIEKDGVLTEKLKEVFNDSVQNNRLMLIHGDILTENLTQSGLMDGEYKVVANIPYYITGALIRTLLTNPILPESMTLVVQKEIAERIARDTKESLLSLSVKAYGVPQYMGTIKPGAFKPQPKVDSAILHIGDISRDYFMDIPEEKFFKVLRVAFAQKRKQLANNLELLVSRDVIEGALEKVGLRKDVRAEDVSLSEWKMLVTLLLDRNKRAGSTACTERDHSKSKEKDRRGN